jgi:hypothetical protein
LGIQQTDLPARRGEGVIGIAEKLPMRAMDKNPRGGNDHHGHFTQGQGGGCRCRRRHISTHIRPRTS